jgi:hypothetical protein
MRKRFVGSALGSILVCFAALQGCAQHKEVSEVVKAVDMAAVKEHLQTLSTARILLGHQSVGRDVLAGVRMLAQDAGVALRVAEIDGVPPDAEPGLFSSHIGRNGDPDSKCEAFEWLLMRPERPAYDLAMMKFCYVDLGGDPSIEAESMLKRYDALVRRVKQERPDITLVHVSLPLRSSPQGWKVPIKRLLGREIPEDHANAVRGAFNDALRARYAGEPFFDLAALESTYADGGRSSIKYNGLTVHALAPEYTHDGGHLNAPAQRMIAADFLGTLAETLAQHRANGASKSTERAEGLET